jgi:nucleoside-diphosphate-sugar epimerase
VTVAVLGATGFVGRALVPVLAERADVVAVSRRAVPARPLVEGLRNPTVARDERIRALLPFRLTPFDDAARDALTLPVEDKRI